MLQAGLFMDLFGFVVLIVKWVDEGRCWVAAY